MQASRFELPSLLASSCLYEASISVGSSPVVVALQHKLRALGFAPEVLAEEELGETGVSFRRGWYRPNRMRVVRAFRVAAVNGEPNRPFDL